jgi:hypothetical protein
MPDDMIERAPQPEVPAKPAVDPAALDDYFRSIKEPFRETCEGLQKESKSPNSAFIIFFIFSLLPVLPLVASRVVSRLFGSAFISVGRVRFHAGSFWFWWVALFLISLAALISVSKLSGEKTEKKKKWLSPPQMRFAYCYGVVDQIGEYKTNQLPRHIDMALEYFDKTALSLFPKTFFPVDFYPDHYWRQEFEVSRRHASLIIEESETRPPKWYRLQPETELILKAFGEFKPKLRDRLKDRKDLSAIETALTYLSAYQYLEIPELSDSKSETRFEEGVQSLVNFASQMTALPPYRSEELKPTPKQKLSLKFFKVLSKITAPFSHDNPIIAFFFWWVFLCLLFIGCFAAAFHLFNLKVDNAVITTVIGGPILGAITAVTIPRVGKKSGGN